jgi:hypothetical protein
VNLNRHVVGADLTHPPEIFIVVFLCDVFATCKSETGGILDIGPQENQPQAF